MSEFESMMTGLAKSLTDYVGLNTQHQMDTVKQTKAAQAQRAQAEYESQLGMARDLFKHSLEEESKGKDYVSGKVVAKITGNSAFADIERVKSESVMDFFTKMKAIDAKGKNPKGGKIPVSLLDQEAQIIATESMFEQLKDLYFEKDAQGNITGPKIGKTGGVLKQGLAAATGGAFGSKEERQYEQFLAGITGNFARVVSAEKGVLREEDIERAMSLFPRLREPVEVQLKKLRMLSDMLAQRKKTLYDLQAKAQAGPTTGLEDMSTEELLKLYQQGQ